MLLSGMITLCPNHTAKLSTTRCGDAGERGLEPPVAGHGLDKGSTCEDKEEAWQKGHPLLI